PPKPPQEAFDACASAAEGDVCTVTFGGKSHDGKCVRGPDASAPLACAPPRPNPPQEAFDACTGSAEGDACTVTFGGKSHDGRCMNGPDGLACAPPHPPPHAKGPPKEAVDACANLSSGDACAVQLGGESHDGKCVNGPHGELPIACLPNDMPPPPPEAP
ncbi:MAG: hypothetical protein KC776_03735, partial [Myxococcales bacterium]|nr:hypothetical protein [Myxococcales bacterium]